MRLALARARARMDLTWNLESWSWVLDQGEAVQVGGSVSSRMGMGWSCYYYAACDDDDDDMGNDMKTTTESRMEIVFVVSRSTAARPPVLQL